MSSFELIYTSAPRGLKPGTSGFATVAKTRSIPPSVAAAAEALSGFCGDLPNGCAAFSQLPLKIGAARYLIFSRVADCGLDYSGRANYIAHHWAFDAADAARYGLNPNAFWANERDFFVRRWDREPDTTPEKDWAFWTSARRAAAPKRCVGWEKATGDAGWGAIFAATALCGRRATLLVAPGTDLTELFAEALGTLPSAAARRVSFASPFFAAPIGVEIGWRGAWAGAPSENAVRSVGRDALLFDASTSGRVSLDGKTATPESAARFFAGDAELADRIVAARTGRACEKFLSGLRENEGGGDAPRRDSDERPPIRRVVVPGFAPDAGAADWEAASGEAAPFVDEDGRVDLRRRRIENVGAKSANDGFGRKEEETAPSLNDASDEFWGAVAVSDGVFLENDRQTSETERLNKLYDRMADENRRAAEAKARWKRALFWCAAGLFALGVAAAVALGVLLAPKGENSGNGAAESQENSGKGAAESQESAAGKDAAESQESAGNVSSKNSF